jgi:hypothetical protein
MLTNELETDAKRWKRSKRKAAEAEEATYLENLSRGNIHALCKQSIQAHHAAASAGRITTGQAPKTGVVEGVWL